MYLEFYITAITEEILQGEKKRKFFSNISKSELSSLAKLSKDKSILIKKVDKSNTMVIMNRDDYMNEVLRQLGDKKYYEKLDEDPSQSVMQNINKCMDKIKTTTQHISNKLDMAPSYASLFMGKFKQYFLNIQALQPTLWLRFLDDIFFLYGIIHLMNSNLSLKT